MSLALRIDNLERNYIINGAFDLFQRAGASAGVNSSGTLSYIAPDRWRVAHTGTHSFTPNVRRSVTVPDNTVQYSLRYDFQRNASAATLTFEQLVESTEAARMTQSGFMSCAFSLLSPVAASVQLTVSGATALDNHTAQVLLYTSPAQSLSAAAWTELKFEGISIAAGSSVNGLAIKLVVTYAVGSDPGAQSMHITKCMANAGSKASAFSRSGGGTIQDEIASCMRYYEKSYLYDTIPATATGVGAKQNTHQALTATGYVEQHFSFSIVKRAVPSMFMWSPTGAANMVRNDAAVDMAAAIGVNNVREYYISYTNTPGRYGNLFQFVANAEIN